jgi:tetrahydromethanopterin S-methyltransferase subunit C
VSTTYAPARHDSRAAVAPVPADSTRRVGLLLAAVGLVFGVTAFGYEPLVMGSIGITLGLAGKHVGAVGAGRLAVVVAMLGTILGSIFGSVVYALLTRG